MGCLQYFNKVFVECQDRHPKPSRIRYDFSLTKIVRDNLDYCVLNSPLSHINLAGINLFVPLLSIDYILRPLLRMQFS